MGKIPSVETVGTCPHCQTVVDLHVELRPEHVRYHGECPEHGKFIRDVPREDMAELGQKISSTVSFKGQVPSVV